MGGEYNINKPNTQQNNIQNEIEHINKETNLLQDILKKKESISKWVIANRKNTSKKRKKDPSQTKKIQNIVKNLFQNKIEQIENNSNLLQNILAQVKKERNYLKKDCRK